MRDQTHFHKVNTKSTGDVISWQSISLAWIQLFNLQAAKKYFNKYLIHIIQMVQVLQFDFTSMFSLAYGQFIGNSKIRSI